MAIGAIAVGTTIAGGLLNAYSQYSGYQQEKVTSAYNKAILDANQRIDDALADFNIRRVREEGEKVLSSQRAVVGKNGITFSGSALDVYMDSVRNLEMDIIGLELQKTIGRATTEQKKGQIDYSMGQAKAALPLNITSSLVNTALSLVK